MSISVKGRKLEHNNLKAVFAQAKPMGDQQQSWRRLWCGPCVCICQYFVILLAKPALWVLKQTLCRESVNFA